MSELITEEYTQKLFQYWNKYIKEGEPLPETLDIRPIIYESWKRSKAKNVYPFEVKDAKLSPTELRYAFTRNKTLMSVAHSYILNLYSYVKGSNFAIALTDNRGFVLDLVGQDYEIQQRAKKSGLSVGCNRSEEYSGTNGIGTCLATGQPIQIWGREHYIEPHHSYVCSAAPIKNQYGTVIGCMDLIGPIEAVNSHTLAMVCAAVDGIEKELKMHEAYEKVSITNSQLVSTIQSISSGIIMIDNMGIITNHNSRAMQFLKLPNDSLENENLANILDLKHCP
ncbi:MAG: GAF domain-containing protein, partial [Bacillota bacterium]